MKKTKIVKFKALPKDKNKSAETFKFEFDEDEIKKLTLFNTNFLKLQQSDFIINGLPFLKKLSFTSEAGMQFEFTEYDYKNIYAFLHLARPFFLFKEPASFKKTLGIFGKKSKKTKFRKHIKYIGSLYDKGIYQPYFQISIGSAKLFHDDIIMNWLNGEEYHQDNDKSAKVEELKNDLGEDTAKSVFATQLSGRIEAIFLLHNLVELSLKSKTL